MTRGGTPDPAGEHRVDGSVVEPLRALIAAARQAGFRIRVNSAYRSYEDQAQVFRSTKQVGRAARPGHSEHQTGFAIDIGASPASCSLDQCFADTPHGQWLAANAHRFGFTLSYPEGKEAPTGYAYEPWHWRYVGETMATWLRERGLTLTEWLRDG